MQRISYFAHPGIPTKRLQHLTVGHIEEFVLNNSHITYTSLHSRNRTRPVVFHRHIIFYICHIVCKPSIGIEKIARHFGMNHASVIHGCHKVKNALDVKQDDGIKYRELLDKYIFEKCKINEYN